MDLHALADVAAAFWSGSVIQDSFIAGLHVIGALILGVIVGYERTWHGRAAGIRTYAFVCMASAALTVIAGHPASWYGGMHTASETGDTTRVIQGIVTGVGFIGAGVIMRDGRTITGLTTAASIWTVAVIGVLVGIGFYATALVMTLLATVGMVILRGIENLLPAHHELAVHLRFTRGAAPARTTLRQVVGDSGYDLTENSLAVTIDPDGVDWRFVAVSRDRNAIFAEGLAHHLAQIPGAVVVEVSHAMN
ncbi:MAG: MgtC/SapB family protein [Azospirillaceae bacterium]|nr:MgtC/SapB family protein [Azospirillaceae bacterium]